jgi:hypothetical protein
LGRRSGGTRQGAQRCSGELSATAFTGLISDDLDPEIVAIPLDVDERIEIGWIAHASVPLTVQAQTYLDELRAVVTSYGVEPLG